MYRTSSGTALRLPELILSEYFDYAEYSIWHLLRIV